MTNLDLASLTQLCCWVVKMFLLCLTQMKMDVGSTKEVHIMSLCIFQLQLE